MVRKTIEKVDISSVKLVLIQAVNTVTFDSNLSLKCDLSIICPTWIVVNRPCLIDLSGTEGKSAANLDAQMFPIPTLGKHLSNMQAFWHEFTNTSFGSVEVGKAHFIFPPKIDAANPGLCGSDGYCFQAVGVTFKSNIGKKLTVNVSGGVGGQGGNGSKGLPGYEMLHHGPKTYGGPGGDAGSGGWGGNPGEASIYPGFEDFFTIVQKVGNNGNNGIGGTGGDAAYGYSYLTWKQLMQNEMPFDLYTGKGRDGGIDSNVTPKPTQTLKPPFTMKTVIKYEELLVKYFFENNIMKDVALSLLRTLIIGGDDAFFEVGSSLGVDGMIEELTVIHKCYWNFLFQKDSGRIALTATELRSLYVVYIDKVLNSQIDGDEKDSKVIMNLYTSALAALNSFQTTYTIIDLRYLDAVEQFEFKKYKEILDDYSTNSKKEDYCKSIYDDIKQANDIIKLLKSLGDTYLSNLQSVIAGLKGTLKKDDDQNQANAKDAEDKQYIAIAGIVTNFVGKVASNFGPEGAAAGGVLGLGGTILGFFGDISGDTVKQLGNPVTYIDFDPPVPGKPKLINSDSQIFKLLDKVKGLKVVDENGNTITVDEKDIWIKQIKASNTTYLNEQRKNILAMQTSLSKFLNASLKASPSIKNISDSAYAIIDKKLTVEPFKPPKLGENDKEGQPKETKEEFEIRSTTLKKKHDDTVATTKKDLVNIRSLLGAASTLTDIVNVGAQCMQVINATDNLKAETADFSAKVKDLTNFMNTSLDKLFNDLRDMSGNFSQAGSHAALDFSRFKVKRAINGVIDYFKSYFENYKFNTKAELFALFEQYNSLSANLDSIYGRILDNYDKIKLAHLITGLNMNEDTSDKPYNEEYLYFKLFHESLLVAKEGNSILFTARQLYFPDSISFNTTPFQTTAMAPVPKNLDDSKNDVDAVDSLVSEVLRELNEVRLKGALTNYCQTAISKYQNTRSFNGGGPDKDINGPSFCICRDVDKIRRILQMKKKTENHVQDDVFIDASINAPQIPSNFEAVRFTEIYVKFYRNSTEVVELESILSKFKFVLTSSGFYDYKYNG